jgi:hypothetical protein
VRRGDSQALIAAADVLVKSCKSLWLISGTQAKRIRTESVTSADSVFVPYQMWRLAPPSTTTAPAQIVGQAAHAALHTKG